MKLEYVVPFVPHSLPNLHSRSLLFLQKVHSWWLYISKKNRAECFSFQDLLVLQRVRICVRPKLIPSFFLCWFQMFTRNIFWPFSKLEKLKNFLRVQYPARVMNTWRKINSEHLGKKLPPVARISNFPKFQIVVCIRVIRYHKKCLLTFV